jgi:hypothetical protein
LQSPRDAVRKAEEIMLSGTNGIGKALLTRWLPALVLASGAACSSTDVASSPPRDGDTPDGGAAPDGGDSIPEDERPAPVFLEPAVYEDLIALDARLPFGVTRRHRADETVLGSHWGRHGGPMVTTGVYDAGGATTPAVIHWTLPEDPTGAATSAERPLAIASGLPKTHYYGADGMVDLPFGPFALLSYTGTGDAFPGEVLLYSGSYDAVTSRAKANGFYSGAGITNGTRQLVVYSGLSPIATTDSAVSDNGLYRADVCDGALAAPAPCPEPKQLFGWKGSSGPVVTDTRGNVFVGASLTGSATSDAVYGAAKAQVLGETADAAKLVEIDSDGTASLAAVAPTASLDGWVFGLGYDANSAVYAGAYVEGNGALAKGAGLVEKAISKTSSVSGLSVFTDAEGDLWLAVVTSNDGYFLELRRRTP